MNRTTFEIISCRNFIHCLIPAISMICFSFGPCQGSGPEGSTYSLMIQDFEGDSIYLDEPGPDGWCLKKRTNGGLFTWEVDEGTGANGTGRSLRMHVSEGVPYFYYLNSGQDPYVTELAEYPVNRMRFFIKFPRGWRRTDPLPENYNFHIGTYHRDPDQSGSHETHNWHFYYHLVFDTYDDDWIEVDLNMWPQHQRNYNLNPGVNPTKPAADFFGHLTRIYFTGVPYFEYPQVDYPYDVWFDEFEFYYHDEKAALQPEYYEREITPGSVLYYPVAIINTHETEYRRYGLLQSTNLFESDNYWTHDVSIIRDDNGDGIHQENENATVAETPSLGPGEASHVFIRIEAPSSGAGSNPGAYWWTSFTAYQQEPLWEPDPHIVPGSTNFQIAPGTPSLSCQVITRAVDELPPPDTIPPSPVEDLQVIGSSPVSLTLRWTAPGDDGSSGTPFGYDLRYSTSPITPDTFDGATPISGEYEPQSSGSTEQFILPPVLTPDMTYYVALKVYDEAGNDGGISNTATGWTLKEHSDTNQSPHAAAHGSPGSGDSPLLVILDGSDSYDTDGVIRYYLWDFGDGTTSTAMNPTHTYTLIGTHSVVLTIVDDMGDEDSDIVMVQVTPGSEGTIRLQEGTGGYVGSSINQILSGENADNVYLNVSWATRMGLYGGTSRLIVRFNDLSDVLPRDSEITSAELLLYQLSNNCASQHVIECRPVLRDFVPEEVTWNRYAAGTPWQQSGASGDLDAGEILDTTRLGMNTGWREFDILPAVSSWLAGELENNGVLLRSRTEDTGYSSYAFKGYEEIAKRPVLQITFRQGTGTGPDPDETTGPGGGVPRSPGLEQNYPNPFNPQTRIVFFIPEGDPATVKLAVYSARGRKVRTLFSGPLGAGRHEMVWDGKSERGTPVPSGVYFSILEVDDTVIHRKMILLR